MLEAHNICFSYYKKPLCLKDVCLTLNNKEKIILFAPEEMGKTTFLKVLSSFEDKYFGKILYKGKDLKSLSDEEKNFSLIFAEPIFIKGTIRKNIDYLTNVLGVQSLTEEKLSEMLNLFEIEKKETDKIKILSILEKRKLMLLRAYIKNPDIIFVDDIFYDLESKDALSLLKILNIASERSSLIFTCGVYSFKLLKAELSSFGCNQTLYLNFANLYKFENIDKFLNSKVDFMSLSFSDDWQSDICIITKSTDGYYISVSDDNYLKIDKIFEEKLNALKLEIGDTEEVYFVSPTGFDVKNLKNNELNKGLKSLIFSIFATLDGSRVI